MKNRKNHTGKNQTEKSAYYKFVRGTRNEPTMDVNNGISTSDSTDEIKQEQISQGRRKTRKSLNVVEHITKNWPTYLITIVTAIIVFLAIDAKVKMAEMNTKIESNIKQLDCITNDLNTNKEKVHSLELQIYENRMNIEFINDQAGKKKK